MVKDVDLFSERPLGRRQFIRLGVGFVAGAALASASPAYVRAAFDEETSDAEQNEVLVVLQLGGGNDGLNTAIPYANGLYHDARQALSIDSEEMHLIDDRVALHPSMYGIKELYDRGEVAIVEGVGYPSPNRSHFRSMDIWHTASTNPDVETGWLGRLLDASTYEQDSKWRGVNIGGESVRALAAGHFVPSLDSIPSYVLQSDPRGAKKAINYLRREKRNRGMADSETFQYLTSRVADLQDRRTMDWLQLQSLQVGDLAQQAEYGGQLAFLSNAGISAYQSTLELHADTSDYEPAVTYPEAPVSNALKTCAELINSNLGTGICYVTVGGFDTHGLQLTQQAKLLNDISDGLLAFHNDLRSHQQNDRVTTFVWSEFGRRFAANGSGGTDHGTAGTAFLIGGSVEGGLYGEPSSLKSLDGNKDLRYTTDFRSIYTSIIDAKFNVDPRDILDANYPGLPLFRSA